MKHPSFCKGAKSTLTVIGMALSLMQVSAQPIDAQESTAAPGPAAPARSLEPSATASEADTDAPVKVVRDEKPLPSNINPRGPLSEVIKLANSGVNESVMLAFVTNSVRTFNLSAEEIIYLNDIGVPGAVVTAMIQRDQEIKAGYAAPVSHSAQPPQPPEPANESNPPPAPPVDSSSAYAVEAPLTPAEGDEEMFYDSLAPYGAWVDVAGYGRCWQPTVVVVNAGWQPYFNCGHWVYSDCGWYWLSDYSWGWAPFHYGNWFRHASLGWCWVPGRTWGPSWVSWRYDNDYCGWAPLPPGAEFVAGVGLTFHGHHVGERDDLGLRPDHYHFVAWNHFHDRQLQQHRLPPQIAERAYDRSVIATRISGDGRTTINNALPVSRVAAATQQPIHTVALRDSAQAPAWGGRTESFDQGGRTLAIYRARPGSTAESRSSGWTAQNNRSANSSVHSSRPGSSSGQSSSLILRGPQSSAMREAAPRNSLVVVGPGSSRQPSALSQPSATPQPSALSQPPAASQPSAPSAPTAVPARSQLDRGFAATWPNQSPESLDREPHGDWRGTVTRSPEPSWFNGNPGASSSHSVGSGAEAQTRSYPSGPRPAAPEFARPTPAPTYVPQRSYSPPSWSAPASTAVSRAPSYTPTPSVSARPAPSAAPSAPAAPAPSSSSHSSGSSGRGNRS